MVQNLEGEDIPAVSEANILSTFEQLHQSKGEVFERGVINVFKGLSRNYKTNSPCKFGTKIIVTGLVKCDRWGFGLNWGWQRDRLADIERMLVLLDGKPVPDNRADVTRRLGDHIHENRPTNPPKGERFLIKNTTLKRNTTTSDPADVVGEKRNDTIAPHHPMGRREERGEGGGAAASAAGEAPAGRGGKNGWQKKKKKKKIQRKLQHMAE